MKSYGDFLSSIQRKFGDTSSDFNALVADFLDDRLVDFESEEKFRDLQEEFVIQAVKGDTQVDLSSISSTYTTDALIYMKPTNNSRMRFMTLENYGNERINDLTGIPSYYIPLTQSVFKYDKKLNDNYSITCGIVAQHQTVSLTSDMIRYSNDKVKTLKFGVIADLYEDRGDDRSQIYEAKAIGQLNECRTKARASLQKRDTTLRQGSSIDGETFWV